jgi:hypothetical protein
MNIKMRAKTLSENSFERGGEINNRLRIGKGPLKYANRLEKILDLYDIKYSTIVNEENGTYFWKIDDENPDLSQILIFAQTIHNPGWYASYGQVKGTISRDNPFGYLRELIEDKWRGIKGEINSLEESLSYLKKMENRIDNIDNYLKDEN